VPAPMPCGHPCLGRTRPRGGVPATWFEVRAPSARVRNVRGRDWPGSHLLGRCRCPGRNLGRPMSCPPPGESHDAVVLVGAGHPCDHRKEWPRFASLTTGTGTRTSGRRLGDRCA
jgi:hypothetical protein